MKSGDCCDRGVHLAAGKPKKEKPAVRISATKDGALRIQTLNDKRRCRHGFGSFFWNATPKEIVVTDEALNLLRQCVNRKYSSLGDLFGLSIDMVGKIENDDNDPHSMQPWKSGLLVNYGASYKSLKVPLCDATIELEAYMILEKARAA